PPASAPWRTFSVDVGDRTLEAAAVGDESRPAVVLHHGTPQSFVPMTSLASMASEVGVRLVTFARAGYRSSSRLPGRTVADVAVDTVAVLDHLGIRHALTAGVSGGGPHALACAALLPDRVRAAASVCGVAPHKVPGLDFLDGMGADNVAEFGAAVAGEDALRTFLEGELLALADLDAASLVSAWDTLLPDVDKACLTGDVGAELAAATHAALDGPVDGWLDDDLAFVQPWGVDLASIRVPVSVWQGGRDLMVPYAHGSALRDLLPGAVTHLLPDEGHLSIVVASFADVLRELLELGDMAPQQ
ncbi:MAG: alpha/beta fold hydrolase, partial [Lapillicoccus sp.]